MISEGIGLLAVETVGPEGDAVRGPEDAGTGVDAGAGVEAGKTEVSAELFNEIVLVSVPGTAIEEAGEEPAGAELNVGKTEILTELDSGTVLVSVPGTGDMKAEEELERGTEGSGKAGDDCGPRAACDDTGQTVVDIAIVEVKTWVECAGQLVTVGAQLVIVISVVLKIVEVVKGTFVAVKLVGATKDEVELNPTDVERLPAELAMGATSLLEIDGLMLVRLEIGADSLFEPEDARLRREVGAVPLLKIEDERVV